jgi:alkylmercury lyase
VFRLLAQGEPVPTVRLAAATGLPDAEIERFLERWHGVHRADGAIVAFQGLSLVETAHGFRVDGRQLYTWCAWDTLFLPELLQRRAEVESACPTTGVPISLSVDRDGPEAVAPGATVMSFRPESPVFVDAVQQSFCRFVHFFSSAAAAASWVAERPGTIVISLQAGFEIGRRTNAAQFGAALRRP